MDIINTTSATTGSTFKTVSNDRKEFITIQSAILHGTKGTLTADGAMTDPLTSGAGTITFRLADYGTVVDGNDTTDYTVSFDGDETLTEVKAVLNAAFGSHATASDTAGTLVITNDKIGGSNSTVTYVSTTNNTLGDQLGFTNGSGTGTGTPALGITSGSVTLYGRNEKNMPWVLLNTYTTNMIELVALCNQYRAITTSMSATGPIRLNTDTPMTAETISDNFRIDN